MNANVSSIRNLVIVMSGMRVTGGGNEMEANYQIILKNVTFVFSSSTIALLKPFLLYFHPQPKKNIALLKPFLLYFHLF